MEFRYLESFLVLSATLHFGQAAERVYLSQSALSRQIQQLEAELGVALFERSGRRVALTPAGRILASHARRVMDEIREARLALAELDGCLQGGISISCFDGASVYLIPNILASLHSSHSGIAVSVATHNTKDALRAVRDGTVDAAMVVLPVPLDGLQVLPLFREELVLVLPAHHPLRSLRRVPIKSLRDEPLITARKGQNTRLLTDRALSQEGCTPMVIFELESVHARKDAVRAGIGVAILGKMSVLRPPRGAGLITRPLSPPIYRGVGLVTRSGRPPDFILTLFAQTAVSTAIRLGGDPIEGGGIVAAGGRARSKAPREDADGLLQA